MKKRFYYAAFFPLIIAFIMIISFVIEKGLGLDFHTFGIYPRNTDSFTGVFSYIFVHSDWSHLFNNIISFIALGITLYFFYTQIATKILLLSYLISGSLLWIIGRESWHVGASGLIYALAFFLFLSGILRLYIPLIAISLIIIFVYGNMIWHIFPWKINDPISWEGHLTGGFTGVLLAYTFRKSGPQKPVKIWDDDQMEAKDEEIDYL